MTISSTSKWTSSLVRRCFIDYFVAREHKFVPSSPVISSDPSLLFVNAGMNQFKDIFPGNIATNHPFNGLKRAVSSQKCIRTGGKHNDLDVVGYNLRHHTFFEMLGNWSFNDYFKKEACSMALDLITNHFKLPRDRLIITYFSGDPVLNLPEDQETREIWLSLGLPAERIIPLGAKENFWEMGEVGPCGVCSEIHYQLKPGANLDDCLEIWNLVFMQYNKNKSSNLTKLECNNVDTGMGLERMTSVLNNVSSNYDTDLFLPLFQVISQLTKSKNYQGTVDEPKDIAFRIVADHSRMITVSLADGLQPGTKDAGRHFRKLFRKVFAHLEYDFESAIPEQVLIQLSRKISENLGHFYPEIPEKMSYIEATIEKEAALAQDITKRSKNLFDEVVSQLEHSKQSTIPGEAAFDLFLNGGASLFMMERLAQKRNLTIDWEGFRKCFAMHKSKSAEGLEEARAKAKTRSKSK